MQKIKSNKDNRVTFYIPDHLKNQKNIELSIVVPAYNEKKTIAEFVEWCKQGLKKINLTKKSEIIIVDSSNDGTDKIALKHGAKVVKTPLRGLGRAYLDSVEFIGGKYLILGDADCTYDFRKLSDFYKKFKKGYEFIMGSRRKGYIEKGSMPKLHRYFGIPITNFLLNFIYNSHFSDIHCGMRGVTLAAFKKMNLNSQKWDYASEMLIKAIRLNLKSTETPINFYNAINNRESVHVREGWFSPWIAGLQNLNQMLIFGSDYIFKKISKFFIFSSSIYFLYVIFISNTFMSINFHLHWSFIFFIILTIGTLFNSFSDIIKISYSIALNKNLRFIKEKNKIHLRVLFFLVASICLIIPLVTKYISSDFELEIDYFRSNLFILGIFSFFYSVVSFFELYFYLGIKKLIKR